MFLLRLIGKVLLIPVWILVAIAWIFVKAVVSIYSFAREFVVFGLGALMIGTLICYHDWKQFSFLLCIAGISLVLLLIGTSIELSFEKIKKIVGNAISTL